MKKIEAVIGRENICDVFEALRDMGIYGMVITELDSDDLTIALDSFLDENNTAVTSQLKLVFTIPNGFSLRLFLIHLEKGM